MGVTKEALVKANKGIKTVPIKGKNYAMVAARVQAFREMIPNGTIDTTICDIDEEQVVIQAKIYDEKDHLLASGTAEERKSASKINDTSYVENCETSAVGRALGMLGIGSEDNMASADEMTAALINQVEVPAGKKILRAYCSEHALDLKEVWDKQGLSRDSSEASFYYALADLMKDNGE